MKVRVKKGLRYCFQGESFTHDSLRPLVVSEEKAQELVKRGIVDVEEEKTPTPQKPLKQAPAPLESSPSPVLTPDVETPVAESVDYESMTLVQLREECAKRGLEYTSKTRKADLIALLENA